MLPEPTLFDVLNRSKSKIRGPYSTREKVRLLLLDSKIIRTAAGCCEWQGKRNKLGYGFVTLEGKEWLAHRASYYLATGDHPGKYFICHTCDNPPCVNAEHLFKGTQADNMRDCSTKGRTNREKTNFGESHHDAKLTIAEVREIRCRYAAGGVSCKSLGMEFGVDQSNIHQIVTRQTWKDV